MKRNKKDKLEIDLLSRYYLNSKRILNEYMDNIMNYPQSVLEYHRRNVYHMEYVAESLRQEERLIIEKEVLEGQRGKWYRNYFSEPSYYRYRVSAYANFLRCL